MSTRALPKGTVLSGKYRIDGVIGEGGFGITYAAWDTIIQTRVAIKEYFPSQWAVRNTASEGERMTHITMLTGEYEITQYQKGLERFVREAENLARFQNLPGIVQVRDFFYENGTAYMVMEYIVGTSLEECLQKWGNRVSVEAALNLMGPLVQSLSEIHKAGMIHRDISTDNIMVTEGNKLKLIDFGAARFVEENSEKSLTVILKHGYAPPEQYQSGGRQGAWTDVYALCAVIYRMISGKIPPDAPARIIENVDIFAELKEYEGVTPSFIAALQKGMELEAQRRYQNVQSLYAACLQREDRKGWLCVSLTASFVMLSVVLVIMLVFGKRQTVELREYRKDASQETGSESKAAEELLLPDISSDLEDALSEEIPPEPEYLIKLREYYDEHYREYAGKIYFADLTGDGVDELLFSYGREMERDFRNLYANEQNADRNIVVLGVKEGEVKALWEDLNVKTCNYLLTREGEGFYLERQSWQTVGEGRDARKEFEKKRIVFGEDETVALIDTNTATRGIIILDAYLGHQMVYDQDISDLHAIQCAKRKMMLAFDIAELEGRVVMEDVGFVDTDSECYFFISIDNLYGELGRMGNTLIWWSDGEKIQRIDCFDGGILACDVYQFGKAKHFYVSVSDDLRLVAQYKYYAENGQITTLDCPIQIQKLNEGQMGAECLLPVEALTGGVMYHAIDYTEIIFLDGKYFEYGVEDLALSELKKYDNYETVLEEAQSAVLNAELYKNSYEILGEDWYTDFYPEGVKLKEALVAANDKIYLNYEIYGYEALYDYEENEEGPYSVGVLAGKEDLSVWGQAVLQTSGSKLELVEAKYGRKQKEGSLAVKRYDYGDTLYYETEPLGFPLYYGAGRDIVYPDGNQ